MTVRAPLRVMPFLTGGGSSATRLTVFRAQRIISFALLCGWLFAIGHVACEHDGMGDCGAHVALLAQGADPCDCGAAPGNYPPHHHELTAFAKLAEDKPLTPVWVPISGALMTLSSAALRDECERLASFSSEASPPDRRALGWLLVVQTAHPVRGPSLV